MIDWAAISLKELAGFLSEELRKREIDTVLVGGACVTIYSENRYQSYDLDYVTYEDMKKVKKALLYEQFFSNPRFNTKSDERSTFYNTVYIPRKKILVQQEESSKKVYFPKPTVEFKTGQTSFPCWMEKVLA